MALARAGQRDAASEILSQVLAVDPEEPDALQLLGMIVRATGEAERAAALYRRSLQSNAKQPHVYNNLGNVLLDLDRTDEAIKAYRAALKLQPAYADALTNLGLALVRLGDAAAAEKSLRDAIELEPANAKSWAGLGQALRAAGDPAEAVAAFLKSLSLRPNHVPTLHNLAVALRLQGEAEKAASILESCAVAEPKSAEVRYNLGHCYFEMGRIDDAANAYRAAIAIQPTFRDAHDSLSRLLWQRGDTRDFIASYVAALHTHSSDVGLLTDLSSKLNLAGHASQVVRLLEDALGRGVEAAAIHHKLGQAYWAEGRHDSALLELRAAIEADPEAIEYRLELARALIIRERYRDSLEVLAPALDRQPFDQQAIAYQALAWRFLSDPRSDRLNDYQGLIQAEILQPPAGWGSLEDFNRRVEKVLARLHTATQHPLEQTLRGGTQTMGNLFDQKLPEIHALRQMIESSVRRYIASLPDDPQHPFLSRKTSGFRFAGSWSVRLTSGGFHINHVHADGWISSCYYVGLPAAVAGEGKEGWIKFGETGLNLGTREQIARMIEPEIGKLVLFPSYMYHGTISFDEPAYRTTVAFDVVPA